MFPTFNTSVVEYAGDKAIFTTNNDRVIVAYNHKINTFEVSHVIVIIYIELFILRQS